MPESEDGWTFDWHSEHSGGFLNWLVLALISKPEYDKGRLDELSEATKNFTDVRITVQINGIEVDPRGFVEGVERHMNYAVAQEVDELLKVASNEIFDPLSELRDDILRTVRKMFEAKGIPLPDPEEW